MKLTSMLTSGYPLPEILSRLSEWAWHKTAHYLPRRLAYWSYIDTGVRHITSNEVVPDVCVRYMDLLQRLSK